MKKIIAKALIIAPICTTASALTCADKYQEDINKFNDNKIIKSLRKHTKAYHAATSFGLLWAGVPVLPAYLALPVVGEILMGHQKQLSHYMKFYKNEKYQYNYLGELQSRLFGKGIDVQKVEILNEMNYLNESGALCDGSVFYKIEGGRRNDQARRVGIKLPSKSQVINHLKRVLK